MRKDKYSRMMATYDGFKGAQTVSHVLSTIPIDLLKKVTGKQAGQIMSIRNAAYHEGRASQKIDTWAYDAPTDWLAGITGTGIVIECTDKKITIKKRDESDSDYVIIQEYEAKKCAKYSGLSQ